MEQGARIFRASIREVAELANVGTQAVQASLQRLKEAELVKYESRDSASSACLYSLVVSQGMAANTTVGDSLHPRRDSVVITAPQDDAFHARGLGKSSYSIWRLLLRGGALTIQEIAQATGRTPSTVRTNLEKLEANGLVGILVNETTPVRWKGYEASGERLQAIATELGTEGKAAQRKALHVEERQKRVSYALLRQKRLVLARKET